MGRFSAFLQAPGCVYVRDTFHKPESPDGQTDRFDGYHVAGGKDHADIGIKFDNDLNLKKIIERLQSTKPPVSRAALGAVVCGSFLLAACGFNGTDRNEGETAAAAPVVAEAQMAGNSFEEVSLDAVRNACCCFCGGVATGGSISSAGMPGDKAGSRFVCQSCAAESGRLFLAKLAERGLNSQDLRDLLKLPQFERIFEDLEVHMRRWVIRRDN